MRTAQKGKIIYCIDMMISYVELYKPRSNYVDIENYIEELQYDSWGEPENNNFFSPMDVINNPNKYKEEYKRIMDSDLKYPIMIYNNNVLDGYHRIAKCKILKKNKIKAYDFTSEEMKKFIVNKNGDYKKVMKMEEHDFIKLFYKRFCN